VVAHIQLYNPCFWTIAATVQSLNSNPCIEMNTSTGTGYRYVPVFLSEKNFVGFTHGLPTLMEVHVKIICIFRYRWNYLLC
jgi:hypothetical protein